MPLHPYPNIPRSPTWGELHLDEPYTRPRLVVWSAKHKQLFICDPDTELTSRAYVAEVEDGQPIYSESVGSAWEFDPITLPPGTWIRIHEWPEAKVSFARVIPNRSERILISRGVRRSPYNATVVGWV